jgi:hypothetical protein
VSSTRALQRNAADPQQSKYAERVMRRRAARFTDALRASLEHPEVRLVLAELLDRARMFEQTFSTDHAEMARLEGRRSFGLELWSECEQASEALTDLMNVERRRRTAADNREVDAVHTPQTQERTDDDASRHN